jgi:hypothetical protein
MTMMFEDEYLPCTNELCLRKVRAGVAYCCEACSMADEGHYEIHADGILGHSEDCTDRNTTRGEYSHEEAAMLRSTRR